MSDETYEEQAKTLGKLKVVLFVENGEVLEWSRPIFGSWQSRNAWIGAFNARLSFWGWKSLNGWPSFVPSSGSYSDDGSYFPSEQALDQRLDCSTERRKAA